MTINEVHAEPCLSCGGKDIRTLKTPMGMWMTLCYPDDGDGCGATTDLKYSSQSALSAWNQRSGNSHP